MMDDLRYPFSLLFFLFFFCFFCGGGGWSSSRWLFGTQLGWCHAVWLAVPQTSAATFGASEAVRLRRANKPYRNHHRYREALWGDFLIEKTGKNLHKFNQNQALKSILK